jgi:hypothetical protein
MAVFIMRYLDLFWTSPFGAWIYLWNFCFKLFYIASSGYIVFLMTSVFARTREREKAWKFGIYCFAGAVVLSIPVTAMFQNGPVARRDDHGLPVRLYHHRFNLTEVCYQIGPLYYDGDTNKGSIRSSGLSLKFSNPSASSHSWSSSVKPPSQQS